MVHYRIAVRGLLENWLEVFTDQIWECKEIIQELEAECLKLQETSSTGFKGRIQSAGRRVAYPFRKGTLQKLEEDISEIRENLYLALDALQLKGNEYNSRGIVGAQAANRTYKRDSYLVCNTWLAYGSRCDE